MVAPWKKSYDQTRQCIKKQRYHFADKFATDIMRSYLISSKPTYNNIILNPDNCKNTSTLIKPASLT